MGRPRKKRPLEPPDHPNCRTTLHPIEPQAPKPLPFKLDVDISGGLHTIIRPTQAAILTLPDGSTVIVIPPRTRTREAKPRGRRRKGLVDDGNEGP